MDLPKEIEVYIKETIDDSLGLPVSANTLQLKLRATEDAHRRLNDEYLSLLDKSRDRDKLMDRTKAESTMNALALKKFVSENQRLVKKCASLASQCKKWEKECALYERDREALMDFGNEADERAKEAEFKVCQLEDVLERLSEELHSVKHESEIQGAGSSSKTKDIEYRILESILITLVSEEETELGRAFLESNRGFESYQQLLKMWKSLRPTTQMALSLAAQVNMLQKEKENLRVNLYKAEEEVNMVSAENNMLRAENKRLLKQQRYLDREGSGSKHSSSVSSKEKQCEQNRHGSGSSHSNSVSSSKGKHHDQNRDGSGGSNHSNSVSSSSKIPDFLR
ncbi:uncharacterized protein [Euphorbia lathyris]|uniref:uncharacterized protein isoform X2 n=1 Tax=Euphorbia lathyris TaxID=212925 RepID=UPI0033142D88